MAKHPVPKKKTTRSASRKRYGSFQTSVLKKLTNKLTLVDCPNCKSRIPAHTACPDCGQYRGRQVIDKQKKVEKITKIKA